MSQLKNELETLLSQAATEAAYRPAFFRALLDAVVWVPGQAEAEEETRLHADSTVDLQHWEKEDGTTTIPFFTSDTALQQAISEPQPFVIMPARVLFEMTLGEHLFLNPRLPTGKAFTPQEITLLLRPEIDAVSQQAVLEGGRALLLSAVTEPPAQVIASLTTLFQGIKPVRRAFLCSVRESADERANWLIGIEADGDIDDIICQAGSVATDTLPDDEPVDICVVMEGEKGISHFMLAHISPFYERRWGSFLRDFKTQRIL